MFAEKVLEILPPLSHRNQPVAKSKAPSKNLGGMRDSSWAPPSMEHVRCLTGMQFPVPPSLPPSLLPLLRPQVKHFLPWEPFLIPLGLGQVPYCGHKLFILMALITVVRQHLCCLSVPVSQQGRTRSGVSPAPSTHLVPWTSRKLYLYIMVTLLYHHTS